MLNLEEAKSHAEFRSTLDFVFTEIELIDGKTFTEDESSAIEFLQLTTGENGGLFIKFRNSYTYFYRGVKGTTAVSLVRSEHLGRGYRKFIKYQYPSLRLSVGA